MNFDYSVPLVTNFDREELEQQEQQAAPEPPKKEYEVFAFFPEKRRTSGRHINPAYENAWRDIAAGKVVRVKGRMDRTTEQGKVVASFYSSLVHRAKRNNKRVEMRKAQDTEGQWYTYFRIGEKKR